MGLHKSLGTKEITGRFKIGYDAADVGSWFRTVAHDFPSDQPQEVYKFLGRTPIMKEWIGARQAKTPNLYSMTVVNRKFSSGLTLDADDVMEDKTGQTRESISELGARTALLPEDLLTELIEGNGNAYDGIAMFADRSSVSSGGAFDNDIGQTAATGTKLTVSEAEDGIGAAIEQLMSAKDDQTVPKNQSAKSFVIMTPWYQWRSLAAAINVQFTSASTSNTLQSLGVNIGIFTNGWLSATDKFYVFRMDAAVKPMIFQEREKVKFDQQAEGSDFTIENDQYAYWAKRRGEVVFGEPSTAVRVTVT